MSLTPGSRIGAYEITGAIGAGGMGEVYRARDTKLDRDVAIKILPEFFATDPERVTRFEREAKTLASLNHSNIAQIYGIEERALVMELVEGEDLAQRLTRGAIPVEEALAIARQIADALEAAHERGIIHRDLKPANIKVRGDGTVKVLDFGLAKAMDAGLSVVNPAMSPTFTSPATQVGVILGTAAYMAPEQAKGKTVDKRADIWAFGIVLYEMLTGTRPFGGESVSETLAAVLKADPDWSALSAPTLQSVRTVLAACLEKDPRGRLRDIGDVRLLLDSRPDPVPASRTTRVVRGTHLAWTAACITAAGLGAWLAGFQQSIPQMPVRRFELKLPPAADGEATSATISPDGSKIAYVSSGRLWIHDLNALEPREVPGVTDALRPFWSSDSQWIGYGARRRLWKAPAAGGAPVLIADLPEDFSPAAGGAWRADERIIFTTGFTGLFEVSDRGGDVRVVLPINAATDLDFHDVVALPGNRGVVFYVHTRPGRTGGLEVFDGKQRKVVLQEEGLVFDHPAYSPTGHLLYRRSPTNVGIWAVPFSLDTLEATGKPFLVVAGQHAPSVARDGTLAYSSAGTDLGQPAQLTWVDRSGAVLGSVGDSEPGLQSPALSPDGSRVAVATTQGVIWVYDVARATRTRVTLEAGLHLEPAWVPDGAHLVHVTRPSYEAGLPRIVTRPVDGAISSSTLADGQRPSVSADGRHLVYQVYGGRADIMRLDFQHPGTPQPVLNDPNVSERHPSVSPDGRWLAFTSDASGHDEVYVTSFPDALRKWQVSAGGGMFPRWRSDGQELLFLGRGTTEGRDALMSATVARGPTFSSGSPVRHFSAHRLSVGFDVARDGKRFLVIRSDEDKSMRTVTVVQNWFAGFQQRGH